MFTVITGGNKESNQSFLASEGSLWLSGFLVNRYRLSFYQKNQKKHWQGYLLHDIFIKQSRWGVSSAGRAPALHAGGHRFDPDTLHHDRSEEIPNGIFFCALFKWYKKISRFHIFSRRKYGNTAFLFHPIYFILYIRFCVQASNRSTYSQSIQNRIFSMRWWIWEVSDFIITTPSSYWIW